MSSSTNGQTRRVVVAIDFGTTYSGFAFCKRADFERSYQNPPITVNKWKGDTQLTLKTPTCVLFKPDQTLYKFGFEAMSYYYDNPDRKENLTDWYYFEHFKMILYQTKELNEDTYLDKSNLTEREGKHKSMKAVDVFGAAIGLMKKEVMEKLQDSEEKQFTETDIDWVITVPAIWDLRAKQFMRKAAQKAGIDENQLKLALEPEVASLYCRRIPVGITTEGDGRRAISTMIIGSKYIVLDQGGGTTDIAIHEVAGENKLKEIHQACGGHWGGITVNKQFNEFLQEVLGNDFVQHMKANDPSAYFSFFHRFELVKTSFKAEDETDKGGYTTIRVPVAWLTQYEECRDMKLSKQLEKSKYSSVKLTGDKLRIPNDIFRGFYNYSITSVVAEVQKLLHKPHMKGIKTMLVVGGHSSSTVLTKALQKELKDIDIVVPKDPAATVLQGAVLYGLEPYTIIERIAQFTYGISTTRDFIKGEDPESKKFNADGKVKCDDVFSKHIEVDQVLRVGVDQFQPEKVYTPLYTDQKVVDFKFYDTKSKSPRYITDPGCRHIGSLRFNLSEGLTGRREMALKINYSGTELIAVVTETETGNKTEGYFQLPITEN